MICLDTNAVIAALNERPSLVRERLAEAVRRGERIAIPAIAFSELIYGYEKSANRARNVAMLRAFMADAIDMLPFEADDAEQAGEIRATLERAGTPIGGYDLLIAAQARRHGATLITANTREFSRVAGLDVADWSE